MKTILISFLGTWSALSAQARCDSLLPVPPTPVINIIETAANDRLLAIENTYRLTGNNRQAFSRLLTVIDSGQVLITPRVRFRLFGDLARVSARMRLYPIAMRCYFNSRHDDDGLPADSVWYRERTLSPSQPIPADTICAAFRDGKEATAFALLVHVQQPSPGRRRIFVRLGNVGHTFITLIKYNKDNSIVCRSFGFYPRKTHRLSATPVAPSAPGMVKDDGRHDWNEIAGKFITVRQFHRIIKVLRSYGNTLYNLNDNNCTDFGLSIAQIGGIDIRNTRGRWPLGGGNNPACAGQSILEGTVAMDDGSALFIADNDIPSKASRP